MQPVLKNPNALNLPGSLGLRALAVAAALVLSTLPLAAQPKEAGIWIDDSGDGAVKIEACGSKLCGRIYWLKNPLNARGEALRDKNNPDSGKHTRPICGLPVLGDLAPQPEGGFDGGWVYDPKEGASYSAAIAAQSPTQLKVTGYKGIKFLGQSFIWTRAPAGLPSCATTAAETKPAAAPDAVRVPTGMAGNVPPAARAGVADGQPPANVAPAASASDAVVAPVEAKTPAAVKAVTKPATAKAGSAAGTAAAATKSKAPTAAAPAATGAKAKPLTTGPAAAKSKTVPAGAAGNAQAAKSAAQPKPTTLKTKTPAASAKPKTGAAQAQGAAAPANEELPWAVKSPAKADPAAKPITKAATTTAKVKKPATGAAATTPAGTPAAADTAAKAQ